MRLCATLVLVMMMTVAALAADVTGTWTGDVPRRDGGVDATTFVFKVEGKRLTGTVTTPTAKYEIKEGSFANEQVQFFITVNVGREVKFTYTGKAIDDRIEFVRDIGIGRPVTFIARRRK